MKTLLSADENLLRKQQAVTNGVQVVSKMQFEDRKNKGEENLITLNNQKPPSKNIQPSQRKQSGVPAVKQPVVSAERERSKGRASSRWRQGVTQDSLERLAQESARIAQELRQKKMVYPSWWQGQEEIEKEQNEKQNKNQSQSRTLVQIDPVRAKVHKNLHRYAEDSLDARLRQIRDDSYYLPQDQNQKDQNESTQVIEQSQQAHQVQQKKQQLPRQKNPASGKKRGKKAKVQVQTHSPAASSQQVWQTCSEQQNPLAKQEIKMLEPLERPGNLNYTYGTQTGSLSSFAYTSNKGPAKYSPVRHKTAGASNVPMTYSCPPTQEEMARNANRHVSGNRNFVQQTDPGSSQRQLVIQQSDRLNSFKGASMRKGEAADLYEKGQSIFLATQLEAQRNRMKNQNYMREDLSGEANQDSPQAEGDGMKRYARGGIALTITSVPQDQRSRSGSKAKYPYPDREPFQQNSTLDYRPPKFNPGASQQPKLATTAKRLPKELSGVESTIKSRVEFDKRAYFERQRLEEAGAAYRHDQMANHQVPSDSLNAQIFYLNKDQTRVIYQEGQETYRPLRQPDHTSQSSSTRQHPQLHSFKNSNPGQAGYLRKKASPSKYAAINEELEENSQARIAIQPMNNNYLQSLDSHNETGFTNKLMAQNNSYFVPPPKGHGQLYVPQSNGRKDPQQMNRKYQGYQQHQIINSMSDYDRFYQYNNPHMVDRGQYSQNRQQNYAQQESSVGSGNGEEEYEQTYEGEDQLSKLDQNQRETLLSTDKNNTSRFAFSNERDAAAARDIERNLRQYNKYNQGGVQGLQNQLEHVLMMKSTEFNTSVAQNNESAGTVENIDGEVGFKPENRGQYVLENQIYSQNQYKYPNQPHCNQQKYGNPNFAPQSQQAHQNFPSQTHYKPHGHSQNLNGKNRVAPVASRDSDNQNQYKNQYPATFQQYEQSNQNNFNTSKFPGENGQKYGSKPQLGGQPQAINDSSNNFTLQRPSTDKNNVQKFRNNTNKDQAYLYDPKQPKHAHTAHQNQQERCETQNYKDSMNKRDRDYRQDDIDKGSYPNNNYPMISSGRRHGKQRDEQYVMTQLPNKNYQTFNEDESSFILQRQLQSKENLHNQQYQHADYQYQDNDYLDERQGDNIQEDENEMDCEDDQMGSSSEISDSQQSSAGNNNYDKEIVRGDMDEDYLQQEGEDEDLQETKTEHLRNFMEQAQPADGILDSQIKSQYSGLVKSYVGGEQASAYAELRKHINGGGDQQYVGSVCLQKTNSDITLNKEGGGKEEPDLKVKCAIEMRSQNNYAGLKAPNHAKNGDEFTEESSPQISLSHTDQLESQSSPSHDEGEGYGTQAGEMDAMDSSSFQDSPESQAIPQHYIDQDTTNLNNLKNIQNQAQNLTSHLVKMNDDHLNQFQMVQGTSQDSASLENTNSLQQEHQYGYGQINYHEQQQTTEQRNEQDPSDSLSDLNDSQL